MRNPATKITDKNGLPPWVWYPLGFANQILAVLTSDVRREVNGAIDEEMVS
jgi:hypothetical protein